MGNDLTARISLIGGEEVKRAFRDLAKVGEDFTQKLKSADFTPMNELERSLRRAEFGAKSVSSEIGKIGGTARIMAGLFGRNASAGFDSTRAASTNLGNSIGLTKMQAQALVYTFNDVTASLASGASIMTIAIQQGGQLSQAFGGVRGTFSTLLPMLARFAPLLLPLAAGAAAAGAVKLALSAGEAARELQKAADAAGLTTDQYQKLKQAATAAGLDQEGVVAAVGNMAKAANQTSDQIGGGLIASLFNAGNGVIGLSKTVEDGVTKVRLYGRELKGTEGLAAALGVKFTDASGNARDATENTRNLAKALAAIKDPALQLRAATEGGVAALLPKIRQGPAAVDAYFNDVARQTPQISGADITQAQTQAENMGKIASTFETLSGRIQGALLPIGTTASQVMLDVVNAFRGDNVETPWIASIVSGIGAIADVASKAADVVRALVTALQEAARVSFSGGAKIHDLTGGSGNSGYAGGGHVRGAGTGTSDSILSWLSNGEYVIKAAAVSKFGVGLFHDLNNLRAPKFALGGLVGDLSAVRFQAPDFSMPLPAFEDGGLFAAAASVGPSGGAVRTGDIVINGERAGPFTGGDDAFEQLSRIAQRQRITRI
ncbi:phage tail length tape measure family protein [Methylocystis parvus]|uniref:phage tail length tape measure family protein n=1 Tax=Methylocystis parvus TaxID=134 RepID=UPI003C767513